MIIFYHHESIILIYLRWVNPWRFPVQATRNAAELAQAALAQARLAAASPMSQARRSGQFLPVEVRGFTQSNM
jgi:hypothetical protein